MVPTPRPLKIPVTCVVDPLTVPVPVKILQLPIPVVKVTAVTVAFGLAPQIVWVIGLMVGVLLAGSNVIVAVMLLLGQVLPAWVTITY